MLRVSWDEQCSSHVFKLWQLLEQAHTRQEIWQKQYQPFEQSKEHLITSLERIKKILVNYVQKC